MSKLRVLDDPVGLWVGLCWDPLSTKARLHCRGTHWDPWERSHGGGGGGVPELPSYRILQDYIRRHMVCSGLTLAIAMGGGLLVRNWAVGATQPLGVSHHPPGDAPHCCWPGSGPSHSGWQLGSATVHATGCSNCS